MYKCVVSREIFSKNWPVTATKRTGYLMSKNNLRAMTWGNRVYMVWRILTLHLLLVESEWMTQTEGSTHPVSTEVSKTTVPLVLFGPGP